MQASVNISYLHNVSTFARSGAGYDHLSVVSQVGWETIECCILVEQGITLLAHNISALRHIDASHTVAPFH
jgi:hypothetical protein